MARWFLGEWSKVTSPSLPWSGGSTELTKHTWATALPENSEDFALFVIPETPTGIPFSTNALIITRLYLVRRYGIVPIVEAMYDLPDNEVFHGFTHLTDGSILLFRDDWSMRRVKRVGSQLFIGPVVSFTPPSDDSSLVSPFVGYTPLQGTNDAYLFYGRVFNSAPGYSGYQQIWSVKFRYNVPIDTASILVSDHLVQDLIADPPAGEDSANRFNAVYGGVGTDFENGYISLSWRNSWRSGTAAWGRVNVSAFEVNGDGTLTHRANTNAGIQGGSSLGGSRAIGQGSDGALGYTHGYRYSPTGAERAEFAVYRYNGTAWNRVYYIGIAAPGTNASFSEVVPTFGEHEIGLLVPNSSLHLYQFPYEVAGGYPVEDTLPLGDLWELYEDVMPIVNENYTASDDTNSARSTFVACRMGPRLTLTTFVDNREETKYRVFRFLYDNTLDVPPLEIPRKTWPFQLRDTFERLMQEEGLPEDVIERWAPTLFEWSEARTKAELANYRSLEEWADEVRRDNAE